MSTTTKRVFFWILFTFFAIHSAFIYTTSTEEDKGQTFLTENAKQGKLLFQKYNCTSCHQLYGLGGYMGPDLTNVISAPGKGEAYAQVFIQNGTQRMPNFHLTGEEVGALVAYLKYIYKTGISPVREFDVNFDGTISQKEK